MLLLISQFPTERSLAQRDLPRPLGLCQVSRVCVLPRLLAHLHQSHDDIRTANDCRTGGGWLLSSSPTRTCSMQVGTSTILLIFASQSFPQGFGRSASVDWMNKWKPETMKCCNTGKQKVLLDYRRRENEFHLEGLPRGIYGWAGSFSLLQFFWDRNDSQHCVSLRGMA